jgi:hypothetical protein
MIGVYEIQNIAILFLSVLSLTVIIYMVSRKAGPVKAGSEKRKIYACGEDRTPESMNVFESGFFRNIGKIIGIQRLRDAHSGDLSSYMTWIFVGLVLIILTLVVFW